MRCHATEKAVEDGSCIVPLEIVAGLAVRARECTRFPFRSLCVSTLVVHARILWAA